MREDGKEDLELSSKELVLIKAEPSSKQTFPFLEDLQQKKEIQSAFGSLRIYNKGKSDIIYKIRGNKPPNYRLANSCAVIKPGCSTTAHVRIIDCSLFSEKDLFQLKYISLSGDLQNNQDDKVESEQIQQFWQILESQQSTSSIHKIILPVRILSKDQKASLLSSSTSPYEVKKQSNIHGKRATSAVQFQNSSSSSKYVTYSNGMSCETSMFSGVSGVHSRERSMQAQNNYVQNNYLRSTFPRGVSPVTKEVDYKQLYEKLAVKVDEQDKQLFVLNLDHKKLAQEWKILNHRSEQLKNSEQDAAKRKSLNGINFSSALLIAFISLICGIYFGN